MANIDLITGFLGAGKTTFIKKYLKYLKARGERVAVIENEYGSKGIDSRILRSEGVTTDELYGGCICCTLKVGFHDMLLRLSEDHDRIIVEPSGVYDISQFYSVMSSPEMKGKCNTGNVICVVDPFTLDKLDSFSRNMLKKQIMSSGCVIFSMKDSADISETRCYAEKVKGELSLDNFTYFCYNDLDSISQSGCSKDHSYPDNEHGALYLSTLIKPQFCSCEEMKSRIGKLFIDSECGKVLRCKGVWNSYLINAVYSVCDIYPTDAEEGLNIIGLDLNRKRIKEVLNSTT